MTHMDPPAGRRLWMVLSDDDGNPVEGIELRGLVGHVDITGGEPADVPWFDPTGRDRYLPPDPFTITATAHEVILHRPTPDGGWTPAEQPHAIEGG